MSIHDIPDEELRHGVTGITILCFMDFKTNPVRWWTGYGPLITLDGTEYAGIGDVIQISELQQSYGTAAGFARFSIPNASEEMIARSDNQEEEVNGRRCQVFYQPFKMDASGDQHRGRLIGDPISIFVGDMKDMESTSSAEERTIELEAYGRLSQQGKPAHGRFNDTDQKSRHPGDRGFELLATLKNKTVVWVPGS